MSRGFKVDYGTASTDPLAGRIHDLEAREEFIERGSLVRRVTKEPVIGQYQIGPDGQVSWVKVQEGMAPVLLSRDDPSRFLYKSRSGVVYKKRPRP
jgi:hypothetical protein